MKGIAALIDFFDLQRPLTIEERARVDAILAAVRAEFQRALNAAPRFKDVMRLTAETYVREGNLPLARLWLDRALKQDPRFMNGLSARARVCGLQGDWKAALADLDAAVDLAPFRADLRRERAKVLRAAGDAAAAEKDETLAESIERGVARP